MNSNRIAAAGCVLVCLTMATALAPPAGGDSEAKPAAAPEQPADAQRAPEGSPSPGAERPSEPSGAPTTVPGLPLYRPRSGFGAPSGRVSGGTRGTEGQLPEIWVLAPDHVGLTTQDQPTLYWFADRAGPYPVEVTLTGEASVKPLLEARLTSSTQPGFHAVRLGELAIRLVPGQPYRWVVAIVPDAANRSRDVVAAGMIQKVEASPALRSRIASLRDSERAAVYAEDGLWYDALAAASRAIDAAPEDASLHRRRAALLEQVGLDEVARRDLVREDDRTGR